MKPILFAYIVMAILMFSSAFAQTKMLVPTRNLILNEGYKKTLLVNNSNDYIMQILYFFCANGECFQQQVDLPSAKIGKNYHQIDGDFLIVLKVIEKDNLGNVRFEVEYAPDFLTGCSTYTNYAKGINTIVLDDIHSLDTVTCTQSISASVVSKF